MGEVAKTEQARLLHRLHKEFGDFGGESIFKRLRRWKSVRSPELSMTQTPYRPEWAQAFADEARRIAAAFAEQQAELHHFGSSAIPGTTSKPILDIALALTDDGEAQRREAHLRLLSLGYEHWGESPIAAGTQWYWHTPQGGMQRVVHLCSSGDRWLSAALHFRDYLRACPDRRERYQSEKQRLAAEHRDDLAQYSLKKNLLLFSLISEANAWHARRSAD